MPKNKYNIGDTLEDENGKTILVRGISSDMTEKRGSATTAGFWDLKGQERLNGLMESQKVN